jgi:hypothetical protein
MVLNSFGKRNLMQQMGTLWLFTNSRKALKGSQRILQINIFLTVF